MKNQENFDFEKYLSYKKSNDTTENTEKAPLKEEKQKKAFKFPTFKFPSKPKKEELKEEKKQEISIQNEENIDNNTESKENPSKNYDNKENSKTVAEEVKAENKVEKDKKEDKSSDELSSADENMAEKTEENTSEKKEENSENSDKTVQIEDNINNITDSKEKTEGVNPENSNATSKKKKKNRKNKKRNKNNNSSAEPKKEVKPIEEVLEVAKEKSGVEKIEEVPDTSAEKNEDVTIISDAFKQNSKENKPESERKNIIKDAFGKALDEDIEELNSVKVQDDTAVHYIPRKTKKPFFVIGIIVLIMTMIGLVSTVMGLYNIIWDFANNTKQKEELANYLYPVVMTDPAMFDNPMQLTSEAICKAAIWDIILHEDISKYPHEYGNITIPEQDVEHHATKLFGTGLKFDHKNLGDVSLMFYYSPEKKSYTVPESPKFFSYSPNVEEIQKTAQDELSLLVAYISPSPAWLIQDPDDNSNVGKHMVYILGITDNGYVIKEIKEPEHKEPLM